MGAHESHAGETSHIDVKTESSKQMWEGGIGNDAPN